MIHFHSCRFIKKFKKWYGADTEAAQKKWDEHLNDRTVDRYYNSDGILFMACPSTGTANAIAGSRVGNERSFNEEKKLHAGDVDAIRDERNRILNQQGFAIVFV